MHYGVRLALRSLLRVCSRWPRRRPRRPRRPRRTPHPRPPARTRVRRSGSLRRPDGWLTYTRPMASSLTLGAARTTTVAGRMDADGTCHSSGSGTFGPRSPDTYQEEVGFNPSTCQERILSGTLSTDDVVKLAAASSGWRRTSSGRFTGQAGGSPAGSTPTSSSTTAGRAPGPRRSRSRRFPATPGGGCARPTALRTRTSRRWCTSSSAPPAGPRVASTSRRRLTSTTT
ncbi:MAG: hypothetical protein QOK16_46 [Solirubrobacteraceae bacterium]|nr:hypothetical protein [Solirubrobacteraceae bacterium]